MRNALTSVLSRIAGRVWRNGAKSAPSVLTGNQANVTSTTRLRVSTTPGDFVGGGASNMAFLVGAKDGPNADVAHVDATFWLQTLAGKTEPTRLQYSQTVLLNFAGLSWPHITVATLTKS